VRRLSIYRPLGVLALGAAVLFPACRLIAPTPEPTSTITPSKALPTFTQRPVESTPQAKITSAPEISATTSPDNQVELVADAGQQAAMLPSARADLPALSELNRYNIRVDIDYAGHSFNGTQIVDITNQETVPLDSLFFRLLPNGGKSYGGGSLDVSRIAVDGQEVPGKLSLSDSVLEVPLAQPLAIGESVQVELDFSGVIPVDFEEDASGESGYGIYNFTDGVLALSGWYPILAVYDEDGWNLDSVSAIGDSVYSDTAVYTVDMTTSEDVVIATTGVQVEAGENPLYISGPVRDFFLIMSPEFEVASQESQGVRVNSYYLPGNDEAGQKALEVAVESLVIFSERFGAYPFAELDVVEAPMQNALGVEYPGIVLISSDHYDDPTDISFPITVAHEVAHQWWYSVVGNDVFEEPWLDESLATYSSNVYLQQAMGEDTYEGYLGYWLQSLNDLRSEGQDDVVTRSLSYFEDPDTLASYGAVVYNKGALFFDVLRQEIGDEAFFNGLQSYYQDHKYGIAHTDDLLDAFESAAGRQLDDLYQEWLYSAQE